MRRVHRTLMERLSYLAIYECKVCHHEDDLPRTIRLHLGKTARCPKCATYRLVRLKEPDHIDRMHTGLLNALERMAGGKLYHCRYCRLQFFDRRRMASEVAMDETVPVPEQAQTAEAAAPGGDGSDA